MKKDKIIFLKEKNIKKIAEKNYDEMCSFGYAQNPIVAKLLAFQKTKRNIDSKDLLE